MTRHARRTPPAQSTTNVQLSQLPTKPAKAYVAMLVTLAGLLGIHLTSGTAQALVMAGQLLLVGYGVWRTTNRPRLPQRGRGVSGFLS